MLGGDVADQLHDDDRLADAGASVGPDLPSSGEGGYQVDDLETRLQHLGSGLLFIEGGRFPMDGPAFLGLDLAQVVQGPTRYIEHTPQGLPSDGHRDGLPRVDGLDAPGQPVRRGKGQTAHPVIPYVLLHL